MKTIMIVDDKADVRELVEVTLGISDFRIVMASDGKSAIEKAREVRPDLVILDVIMGDDMDGFEVCKALKTDPETAEVHVIMLTARARDGDRERGLDAGADDYLTKPFSPLELMNKVEDILG